MLRKAGPKPTSSPPLMSVALRYPHCTAAIEAGGDHRMQRIDRGYPHRAVVAAQRRIAADGGLTSLEVRQQVVESPTLARPRSPTRRSWSSARGRTSLHWSPTTRRCRGPGPAATDDPVADCTMILSPQSAEPPIMVGHNCGTALAGGGVALPASGAARACARLLREPAGDHAAGGAGATTMKSNEFDGVDRVDMEGFLCRPVVNSDIAITIALILITATLNLLSSETWMVTGLGRQAPKRQRRCWKPPPTC